MLTAVGEGGMIVRSSDNGTTWTVLDSPTTATGGGDCTEVGVEDDILAIGPLWPPFPNPLHSHGQVRFRAPRDSRYRLEIYDLRGRRLAEVYAGSLAEGQQRTVGLETDALPAGVYYLRLSGGGGTSTQRFTVVR